MVIEMKTARFGATDGACVRCSGCRVTRGLAFMVEDMAFLCGADVYTLWRFANESRNDWRLVEYVVCRSRRTALRRFHEGWPHLEHEDMLVVKSG